MKVIAINGSPRKDWNTATLLLKALEGAASQGAETKLIHLYDLDYKGCISCFSCKRIGGASYGRCAVNDGLTPILREIETADALILGSPIYIGTASGEMRCFLERLLFPYVVYDQDAPDLFDRKIKTGFIYTMGATEEQMVQMGVMPSILFSEIMLKNIFGHSETRIVTDTYQFDDYSKYVSSMFDPDEKARRRQDVFPQDCDKAYDMGASFARRT